jgi:hypothetical protein
LHTFGNFQRKGLAAARTQGFVDSVTGVDGFFHFKLILLEKIACHKACAFVY